jgi:biotin carboxylase
MPTILCVATYFKGEEFLRECHRLGARVLLVTVDTLKDAAWPRDAITDIRTIPRHASESELCLAAAHLARGHRISRIVALDDFDVESGALLREFFRIKGFGRTVAARFRDKLAMRTEARRLGLRVPAFTAVFNDDQVREWADRVPAPWVLKPRSAAAATGIRKIASSDELRPALAAAGDSRPFCLLEQFMAGEVCHVDSIVSDGRIVFAVASRYGRPPMQIAHEGGVFVTRTLAKDAPPAPALLAANSQLLTGFGLGNGVSHTEFIVAPDGGAPVFLETSARVGGAFIVDVIEAATGVNLWREWARLEIAGGDGTYVPPRAADDCAGLALCLARQSEPDTSSYAEPEIAVRIRKDHHAGLIVRSSDPARIQSVLEDYVKRFGRDFLATMPAPDRPIE